MAAYARCCLVNSRPSNALIVKKSDRLFKCLIVKCPVKSKTVTNGVCNRKPARLNLSQATEVTLRMDYLFRLAADPTEKKYLLAVWFRMRRNSGVYLEMPVCIGIRGAEEERWWAEAQS